MPSSHDSPDGSNPSLISPAAAIDAPAKKTRKRRHPPPLSVLSGTPVSDALTPGQVQLLADIEALRRQADEVLISTNRIKPKSEPMYTYVRYVNDALWYAEHFLRNVATQGGELVIVKPEWPASVRQSSALAYREAKEAKPANIIDLAAYRGRLRPRGSR
jgi:hypothetical protein